MGDISKKAQQVLVEIGILFKDFETGVDSPL